jgi:outer membrane lipoprotein-sorting protein
MVLLLLVMFLIVLALGAKLVIQQARISEQLKEVAKNVENVSAATKETKDHVTSWEVES